MNRDQDEGMPQQAVPDGMGRRRARGKVRRFVSFFLDLLDGVDLLVGAGLGVAIVLMTWLDQWGRSPAIALVLLALLLWRIWKAIRRGLEE